MDPHSEVQRIVAALSIIAGFFCPSAGAVHLYHADFDLPIPANPDDTRGWMADAVINMTGHIMISDLNVCINVTHTNIFDLQIFLQSPAGTSLCLNMYNFDEFFIGADYVGTIFDDEARAPIEHGSAPFTGRFTPRSPGLSIFDGEDSFGAWRLRIYDAWYADTGSLNNLQIAITTPEPATAALLILGAALASIRRPRRRR